MLLEAVQQGCVRELAVIASALSIQDPMERPLEKSSEADRIHAPFRNQDSDFLTLLAVWNRYHHFLEKMGTQNQMRKFCREHFLSFNRMREWIFIHQQIISILKEQRMPHETSSSQRKEADVYSSIHISILSGLLSNIARKKQKNLYLAAREKEVMLFPGSSLFNRPPQWIVAAGMVKTSRIFARTAARIEPQWIEDLAGPLCKKTYLEPHWERDRGEVRANERVSLYGLVIVTGRSISYGKIDPEESHRVFIQSALIEGDVSERFSFLEHNMALIKHIAGMEEKIRRRGILADEAAMTAFYSERLPGVCDIRTLKRAIKQAGGDDFLKMTEEQLLRWRPDDDSLKLFPDLVAVGNRRFPCKYKFSPGDEEDGVTVSIPATAAMDIQPEGLEWTVPGLVKEKIAALLSALPKAYRKKLTPLSDTARIIEQEVPKAKHDFISTIARIIRRRFEVDIPGTIWASLSLPRHLQLRFSITDNSGAELVAGRDMDLLKNPAALPKAKEESAAWNSAKKDWERKGVTTWDFGPVPEQIMIENMLPAYPGLREEDGTVCLRLFRSRHDAAKEHIRGVEALFRIRFTRELKFIRRTLTFSTSSSRAAAFLGGRGLMEQYIVDALVRELFHIEVRSREDFEARAEKAGSVIIKKAQEINALASSVLEAFDECFSTLGSLEKANKNNSLAVSFCFKMRQELQKLVPRDFMKLYTFERLNDLPRYIKALKIRAERGVNNFSKDKEKEAAVIRLLDLSEKMRRDSYPPSSEEKNKAIDEFRWMLEEFKVSLFAQELKTRFPVSLKRLEQRACEIAKMF